ncbi:MAG TPA: iron-containing alcohol dehydrogenase [Lacipirellulaceae bacterium]|nr:iron-containing alcohol dehydrogenase [Lacipirellulaceae bacterium]
MFPFDFQCPTRIVFGPGKLHELGALAAGLTAKRVLVVSDRGIVTAGHTSRGIHSLEQHGCEVTLFDRIDENPTTAHVDDGLATAKDFRPDLIVGIGGGSSMDCAKGINFLCSCGGRMHDYWGEGKATGPLMPMIAVPTTAGTGSETQSFALIADAATHVKMACGDKRAAFRAAILDPELTLTQPPRVTALTGIDAIAHALESYVTKRRNSLSLVFSREAWRHLAPNLPRVIEDPNDLVARGAMQLGACLAGLAIENSMLGAAHALANPLTANYGIAHGQAIAAMLPHVIRRNGQRVEAWYRELISCTDGKLLASSNGYAAGALAAFVAELAHAGGLSGKLSECSVPREELPELAEAATEQWTAQFNPVELQKTDFLELYEAAYD